MRSGAFAILSLVAVAACGDRATDPGAAGGAAALTVVAGAVTRDTVLAHVADALRVELRDGRGRPRPGVDVVVEARDAAAQAGEAGVFLCPPEYSCELLSAREIDAVTSATIKTDALGRAAIRVRLGATVGEAVVAVADPISGARDSVTYEVRAGRPAVIVGSVPDTTVYVGGRYRIATAVFDRWGNDRSDVAVRFESSRPGVAMVAADGVVDAVGVGRGRIEASAGSASVTFFASVPPRGVLAAVSMRHPADGAPAPSSEVVLIELDGSNRRRLVALRSPTASGLDWAPNGQDLLFDDLTSAGVRLLVADPTGSTRRVTTDPTPFTAEPHGRFAPDGRTVYLSGVQGTAPSQSISLWRADPDGRLTSVGPAPAPDSIDWRGAVSPDGTRIAYATNRRGYPAVIRTLDVRTGAVTPLDVPGQLPAWSPAGDLLAYSAFDAGGAARGAPSLMRADGTARRALGPAGVYAEGVDWSGDGEWLLVRNATTSRHELVPVAGGESLPLHFTRYFTVAALR